jgi:predicted transcriptional regulator of viral defense system
MSKETVRLGLSAFESKILSGLSAEGKSIFYISELAKKIGSKVRARKLVSTLAKKKWLERLAKGTYLILELSAGSNPEWSEDSFYIASKLAKPYYIGYLSMLNYYGWTEQIPLTVTVATTKSTRRKKILGVNYDFFVLSKKKFFGYNEINIRGHVINVSNREKTLADALDHPEYCGGIDEVAKALSVADKISWKEVIKHASKMGNGAVFKRLGFLLERMNVPVPKETIEAIKKRITKGYAPLYPGIKAKGRHDAKWNIIINTNFSKEKALA